METNMGNSELLYEVIDILSDEEFKEVLDKLDVAEKAEDVIAKKDEVTDSDEESIKEGVNKNRRQALENKLRELEEISEKRAFSIQEKLSMARRRAKIEEKLQDYRKKQIEEKLMAARKRARIEEKLMAARKRAADKKTSVDDIKVKLQEKLELARKKKAVMERVMELRNNKK